MKTYTKKNKMETIKFKSSVNWNSFKDMDKKYILTEKTKEFKGHTLHRIQAVKDFGYVKKNDLGGWIEFEKNLAQDNLALVSGDAKVFNSAQVFDNATVTDLGFVNGCAEISGDAIVTWYTDFMVFRSNWDGKYFTWTKSNRKWKVGDFYGTDEELLEEFYKESKDKGYYYEQYVNFKKQLANLKKP